MDKDKLREAVEIMKLSWNNMTMEEKEINKPLLNLAELYLSASEELPEKKKVDMNAKEGSGAYEFALRNAGFNDCLEQCTIPYMKLKELVGVLVDALEELSALVKGECPRLLDEDSGGCARTDMAVKEALEQAKEAQDGRD